MEKKLPDDKIIDNETLLEELTFYENEFNFNESAGKFSNLADTEENVNIGEVDETITQSENLLNNLRIFFDNQNTNNFSEIINNFFNNNSGLNESMLENFTL